ncbi:alpha/beta fold hydrolase [Streptomyces sp. NPDC005820]|uniref:alpha/beta hydrolase n=1 Tax=Streptomyces sp. NPDC005820 TaxID=3157069 RepID=UPI0033DA5E2C
MATTGATPLTPLTYPVRTFRRLAAPEPGADFERPADYGLSAEPFTVLTADRLRVSGWTFVPPQPWGVVIVCHSRSTGKSRTLRQTRLLYDEGLAVVGFDFRGCGESGTGARRLRGSLWDPLRDLDAVSAYVGRYFGDGSPLLGRVALLGCSFGGNMALAHLGRAGLGRYPALVLDSTPLVRWKSMLDVQLRRERDGARWRGPRAAADAAVASAVSAWTRSGALYRHARRSARRQSGTALLYVAGEREALYDVGESRRFVEDHWAGHAEIWTVPRGRHLTNHVVAPAAYAARVSGFLREAFDRHAFAVHYL